MSDERKYVWIATGDWRGWHTAPVVRRYELDKVTAKTVRIKGAYGTQLYHRTAHVVMFSLDEVEAFKLEVLRHLKQRTDEIAANVAKLLSSGFTIRDHVGEQKGPASTLEDLK